MTDKQASYILSLNGGSSSLKFKLYDSLSLDAKVSGEVKRIGVEGSEMEIREQGQVIYKSVDTSYTTIVDATKAVISWIKNNQHRFSVIAIGHRLVQGGPDHREPARITDAMVKSLCKYIYLAPNHLPGAISMIRGFQSAFPGIPHVACFDTCFHRHMPAHARYYPLPAEYKDKGLMRYGFHGLSYEYIMEKLREDRQFPSNHKVIIAHLGNGASMAAVKNGIGVDTTMGLSPIGGLVMGTRSGDLDPGVILYLLKHAKLNANDLNELLSKRSGLKAIAGTSDVLQLLQNEAADPAARAALTLFCYQAKKFIGAMAAAMGGVDTLVFTGGIGENSAVIRRRICEDLDYMGITLNQSLNNEGAGIISSGENWAKICVIKTDEEWMIAKHTRQLVKAGETPVVIA